VSIDVGGTGDSTFAADSYGTGGRTGHQPGRGSELPELGTDGRPPDPARHLGHRPGRRLRIRYPRPDPGGSYQVCLYFMDWYYTHSGQRLFDVAINGDKVLTNFDVIATTTATGADGQEAFGVEKDFPATVDATGTVTIDFIRGSANQAQINAIAVVPVS
jgi:hypothetical protein